MSWSPWSPQASWGTQLMLEGYLPYTIPLLDTLYILTYLSPKRGEYYLFYKWEPEAQRSNWPKAGQSLDSSLSLTAKSVLWVTIHSSGHSAAKGLGEFCHVSPSYFLPGALTPAISIWFWPTWPGHRINISWAPRTWPQAMWDIFL